MVTDGKPVIIGGIVLSIQQQRTLMWASAFTHRTQENTDINYCFHRSKKIFQEWIITLKILFLCRPMSWMHFEVYLLQRNEKIGSPGRPE